MKTKNKVREVSIIGGADGPTSIFIAGKKPMGIRQRINRYFYKRKRKRVERGITAQPHTLEEVIRYMRDVYNAAEISEQSHNYKEQRRAVRESLITKYKPELLGDNPEREKPTGDDVESVKRFLEKIEERSRKIEGIPEDVFPLDFHIYEIQVSESALLQFAVEKNWGMFGGSYSGNKKDIKRCKSIEKEIYLYYGVSKEDIMDKTERYSALVTVLC